jgi:hypothetical protein
MYEKALAVNGEAWNRRFEGAVLGNLGNLYHDTGRLDFAERTYLLAPATHREVCHARIEGIRLCALALLYLFLGRTEFARSPWREGEAMLRRIGDAQSLRARVEKMREVCAKSGLPPFDDGAS